MSTQIVPAWIPCLVVPAPTLPAPTSVILEQFRTLRVRSADQLDRRICPVHVEARHRILVISHHHEILIRNAQRQWLAYRDAQRQADNGPWRADRGSMASADIEALNVDAIRARIDELNFYAP